MRALRRLTAALLYRRTLRTLDRIEAQLAAHNQLLARLADHFAPAIPEQPPASASVDFLNETEAALAIDYIERTQRDTGKIPTEEEVLAYLADEATTDLHARLTAQSEGR